MQHGRWHGEGGGALVVCAGGQLGNYPNPFNPVTRIRYQVPRAGTVTVRVFDMLGSLVATVQPGRVSAGQHEVSFDGGALASGLYLYEIAFEGERRIGRMSLLK